MNKSSGRLSEAQTEQFQRDGYTLFKAPVFSEGRFQELHAIFEDDLAKFGDSNLDTMHFRDDRLLPFLLSDEILDLVAYVVAGGRQDHGAFRANPHDHHAHAAAN